MIKILKKKILRSRIKSLIRVDSKCDSVSSDQPTSTAMTFLVVRSNARNGTSELNL